MGERTMEDMSLPALFEQARKIHLAASESGVDQETLRKGCEALKRCEEMVSKLGLFSSNETKDDISTTNLKYLLVLYYLAELTEKIAQDDRIQVIKASQAKLKEFMSFCEAMELVPVEELESSVQGGPNSFADRRAKKIARFKRQRAAESKLLEIKERKERCGRSTKASALSTPVEAVEEDVSDDDGEEEREAWLTTISLAICKAFDLLEMLKKEEEMLSAIKEKQLQEGETEISQAILDDRTKRAEAWHRDAATRVRYTIPAQPITCATFAQDVIEGRAQVSQAHEHKHQPLIFGPASLVGGNPTSERERMAAQVFQPSYRLPTMSIEEAGLREMEMMNEFQERNAKLMQEANSAWYKDNAKSRPGQEEDEDDDDDAAQEKARAWDDWKDDNPRGAGNKKLTPCGFIVSFSNNPPDPERDNAVVQEFLSNMEAAFRAHSLWAGCSEELESAGEGLEKYVMTKLFSRVFASVPDDVKVDDQLYEKMALIQQFIRPENLDIQPTFQNETSWLLAQKELQKINMYKAPRDKLVCILNCCKVINNLLLNASIASNQNPPGADEFLPVLIFVTIKANPPQLHSNLLYIQRYRRQSRLVAETAYFFTNILSAESFISNIDANALSMDDAEFQNNMESARALLSGLSAESDDLSSQSYKNLISRAEPGETKKQVLNMNKHQNPTMQSQFSVGSSEAKLGNKDEASGKDQQTMYSVLSTSDLENIGASMLMMEDKVGQIFQDFPYLFSQAGDLTVSNVEELLNNYKQLVFRYVCLSKGMGISNPSPPLSNSHRQSELQAETSKESKDTGLEESNYETQKDTHRTEDDSNGVSLPRVEKSESKVVQDEAVESQNVGNDEVSPR